MERPGMNTFMFSSVTLYVTRYTNGDTKVFMLPDAKTEAVVFFCLEFIFKVVQDTMLVY